MALFKKLFKDDDKIVGLCGFRKEDTKHFYSFTPKFNPPKLAYSTNTQKNLFFS